MTVGLFLTQVSGRQFVDGFIIFYQLFICYFFVLYEASVGGRAREDEAFLSHEEEEEKGRLKNRNGLF